MLATIPLPVISRCLRALVLILAVGVSAAAAHEGHDHDEAPPAPALPTLLRGEVVSAAFQLVAVSHGDELAIYLDRFSTNAPVSDATITVDTPDGVASALPQSDGSYRLKAPWLKRAGHVDLVFTVVAGEDVDDLPLALDIPTADQAAASGGEASHQPSWLAQIRAYVTPGILIPLGGGLLAGWLLGRLSRRKRVASSLLVMLALMSALVGFGGEARAHEGHDHGDEPPAATAATSGQAERAQRQPDGTIFMPKPVQRLLAIRTALASSGAFQRAIELPGRIIPDPNATGYVQSTVGGRLSPPPGGFPRLGAAVQAGDVVAYVTPPLQAIDVSDMRQRQGELDQQITIVESRLARYEQLATSGSVAKSQLEDTRLELRGLKDRRSSLDRAGHKPEALVAPISGVVAEGLPIAGQVTQTNAVVLQIVDPARLWVEALSFEALNDLQAASARTTDGARLPLSFRGSGLVDRSQSIPVHFAIEGDVKGVRAGQFVTVFASTGESVEGIAVARTAVTRAANGQQQVFERVSAERFVPRAVRTAPLDADRVLILAGIEAGKPVVIQGAELLDQVR